MLVSSDPQTRLLLQEARDLAREVLHEGFPRPMVLVDRHPWHWYPVGGWHTSCCHRPLRERSSQREKDRGVMTLVTVGAGVVTAIGAVVLGQEMGANRKTREALDRLERLAGHSAPASVESRIGWLARRILTRRLQHSDASLGLKAVWFASGVAGLGGAMANAWPVCQGAMAIFGFSSVGILGLMGYQSAAGSDEADAREILALGV